VEGIKIKNLNDLVNRANKKYAEAHAQAEKENKEAQEKLAEVTKEGSALTKKLDESRKIVKKMTSEYQQLEKQIETQKKAEIDEKELKEQDVLEGRITMAEFFKKGKTKKQRLEMTIEQTKKELSELLETIRKKNKEILKDELEQFKLMKTMFLLGLGPARILYKKFKELADFIDRETARLLEDRVYIDTTIKQVEHKIHLTEGKGLSAGFNWERLTLKEAKEIQFSPILPTALIPKLKELLAAYEDSNQPISVIYHLGIKGSMGDVSIFPRLQKEKSKNEK